MRSLFWISCATFHLVAIGVWNGPSGVLRDRALKVTRPYMIVTRNTQIWSVFAPNPLRGNRHLIAIVHFKGVQEPREIDLTLPAATRMRQLTTGREARLLKAHDTMIVRAKANWLDGLAYRTCLESKKAGEHPKRVVLVHDDVWMTINPTTFETTLEPKKRATLGSFACDDDDDDDDDNDND